MRHPGAFWAGFTAFMANLGAAGVVQAVGRDWEYRVLAALTTSFFVGAAAYGAQRYRESRHLDRTT